MKDATICDYSDYDYNAEFWINQNRQYEHKLELKVVNQLLQKYAKGTINICDAGCGFGRLFKAYENLFNCFYLVDYAKNLLDQAQERLKDHQNINYHQSSLYDLQLPAKMDAIISIRTLHHLNDVDQLFSVFYRLLDDKGILILDIPNHYHIKNLIKNPFKPKQNNIIHNRFYLFIVRY